MAQLTIKGDAPVGWLLRLVAQGVISGDQWRAMVEGWKPRGGYRRPLEHYTLRHYGAVVAAHDDAAAVLTHVNASCIRTYSTAGDIPAALFLDTLTGLRRDMERIAQAFKAMPRQALTPEEEAAGFGKLDFGLFGIIDSLACRQGVSDEVVKDMTVADVLGKLRIVASRGACERRLTEMRAKKK